MAVQDWWKLQKVVDLGPEGSKTLKEARCDGPCMQVIPALHGLRQEAYEFEVVLGYLVRPC